MKSNLEKINEIEEEQINDDLVYKYLSSKIKYKYNKETNSTNVTNRKIFEICESKNLV